MRRRRTRRFRFPPSFRPGAVSLSAALALAGGLAAIGGCAPANPLIGDWVADPPGVPRSHGSVVRFREACVIVAGSDQGARAVAPARYEIRADAGRFWFGRPAARAAPVAGEAAKVSFLAPDRILVIWPDGHEARYLRGLGPDDPDPDEDCPAPRNTRRG